GGVPSGAGAASGLPPVFVPAPAAGVGAPRSKRPHAVAIAGRDLLARHRVLARGRERAPRRDVAREVEALRGVPPTRPCGEARGGAPRHHPRLAYPGAGPSPQRWLGPHLDAASPGWTRSRRGGTGSSRRSSGPSTHLTSTRPTSRSAIALRRRPTHWASLQTSS